MTPRRDSLTDTELPTFKSNVRAICEPLESLNEHAVEHYDWNEPGSSERAVRMETATAAIEALVQTQQAAVKVSFLVRLRPLFVVVVCRCVCVLLFYD